MKKKELSRRDFLKAGAGAAAGIMTASLLGCSGGSDGGTGNNDYSAHQEWMYRGQRGITAVYQPKNSTLYRQLLPGDFQMPDTLQVILLYRLLLRCHKASGSISRGFRDDFV